MSAKRLHELYFGDVEALDESENHSEYFIGSFVAPPSFSLDMLRNDREFVVVGRKGAGKTASQMYLMRQIERQGGIAKLFSFHSDMRNQDYASLAKTQRIEFVDIANRKNIFLYYDFRDVWERFIHIKIAETLNERNKGNKYTKFATGGQSKLLNLFEGIAKTLKVRMSSDLLGLAIDVGVDLDRLAVDGELDLKAFNGVCRALLAAHCKETHFVFFVDELVFSKLDAEDHEVQARAAMIRDILRVCREMNNFSVKNGLKFHFICSVRPEVRNFINDLDSEIGKILDGKSALIQWEVKEESSLEDSDLISILRRKVAGSGIEQDAKGKAIPERISFGKGSLSLAQFIDTNTWWRPRDIVRFLNAVRLKNPNATQIGEEEIKRSLNEYSRMSMKEISDELGVRYGRPVLEGLRQAVRKHEYRDFDDLVFDLSKRIQTDSMEAFVENLFQLGVILNFDRTPSGKMRFFSAHRDEEFLVKDMGIQIHKGLWHYFNVRSN